MKGKYLLWLLVLPCSSLLAETQVINGFHDPNHALVIAPDGSVIPVRELNLTYPLNIISREGGQYQFRGPDGEQYRVFVPEVVTNETKAPIIHCDRSSIVFADDHRIATARGAKEDCK